MDFNEFDLDPEELRRLDFSSATQENKDKILQTLLSDEKFNKFADRMTNMVVDELKKNISTRLDPVMFILTLTKEMKMGLTMVPFEFCGDEQRDKLKVLYAIGEAFAQSGIGAPIAIYRATEGWGLSAEKAPGIDLNNYPHPSQHPNRQEILIGSCVSIDGRNTTAISDVDRGPGNELLILRTTMLYYDSSSEQHGEDNLAPAFFAGYRNGVMNEMAKAVSQKAPEEQIINDNVADQILKSWDTKA